MSRRKASTQTPELSYIAEPLRHLAIPLGDLTPDPANARKHDEKNIAAIMGSLRQFGQRIPIVVQEEGLIVRAGNGRLESAKRLGWTHLACVVVPEDNVSAVAFAVSDNRSSELATWDNDVLGRLLQEVEVGDADLQQMMSDLAVDQKLVDGLAGAEIVEDEVPEPPVEPITKPGDLWLMGEHRLLCGDSTKAEDVGRLMDGAKVSIVFTDPPYGVSQGAKNRLLNSSDGGERNTGDIQDDSLSPEELKTRLLPAFQLLRSKIMAEDCTLFVTSPQLASLWMMMMAVMVEAKLPARHVLIWKKNQPTFSMNRLDYDYQHEPILLTWGKRHKRPMLGKHKTSVWEIDKPRKSAEHPTMKPVELYANAYLNNSETGDAVADIYGGSGTAIVASEQVGRRCYAMEISPAYCDVAVKRWETLTGRKAELSRA